MSVIAEGVTVAYGNKVVLKDVNLVLGPGKYWLSGPNASGKTTLLKTLSFLIKPVKGRVVAFGKEDARGEVVYVPPSPVLLKGTVLRNLEFGVRIRGSGDPLWAAKKLGIEDLLHEDVSSLSSGQAALVTLGRALAVRPRALMVDEILSYLDEENKEVALKALDEAEVVVIASHEPLNLPRIRVKGGRAFLERAV
ncbi:ABC transporter ATP-binding protein [Ignicoccus hospitalis]|uniref:ABC transporter related n=1 Tax=Ignicoccus hospitalis (strain KIN4/I / DSM 18386 / JCM 14125) TaxID=453591 RepID=A8A9Q1_IGNH4|nr:ATP-binding cassette domain-containing protein [Ignicoccus hospitalis]ABU81653.1 ABC transporter related [Ignicoccus hospitalis KIN4/I]HIH89770.1 ABC transporter ATP-binding protein [Desulfurococcaceae archaeon]